MYSSRLLLCSQKCVILIYAKIILSLLHTNGRTHITYYRYKRVVKNRNSFFQKKESQDDGGVVAYRRSRQLYCCAHDSAYSTLCYASWCDGVLQRHTVAFCSSQAILRLVICILYFKLRSLPITYYHRIIMCELMPAFKCYTVASWMAMDKNILLLFSDVQDKACRMSFGATIRSCIMLKTNWL